MYAILTSLHSRRCSHLSGMCACVSTRPWTSRRSLGPAPGLYQLSHPGRSPGPGFFASRPPCSEGLARDHAGLQGPCTAHRPALPAGHAITSPRGGWRWTGSDIFPLGLWVV